MLSPEQVKSCETLDPYHLGWNDVRVSSSPATDISAHDI